MAFFGGGASVANMVGATSSAAGTAGLVPAPASGKQNSVLMGDATFLNLDKIQMLPDQVSDCVLWLRSDDLVTSGSNVTTWNNKVNSNKNAGQATATKQPTLVANQINGLSAVRFDGTDDCLTISSFSLRAETSALVVFKNASTSKPWLIEQSSNPNNNDSINWSGYFQAFCSARRTIQISREGNSGWSGTSWGIFIGRSGSTQTNIVGYLNGLPLGAGNSANGTSASYLANNSAVSDTLNIGARNDGASLACSADLAEIIFYNRPLFDFEISCINNYLKARYAL